MTTLVSYLLASILHVIGVSTPQEENIDSALSHQQCEETMSVLPYSFINNNEQN